MAPNIHGKMVYSFEKPMWHNITEPSMIPMGAEEILDERFGGGFTIALKQAAWIQEDGTVVPSEKFKIIRQPSPYDPNEVEFGDCTERFHPLQPREIARSFDTNVLAPAETMAFLGKGEDMFISWEMPSFELTLRNAVKDVIELYGIIRCGFDTLRGARLFTSVYRPVCANTIVLAENWAKSNTDGVGRGNIWKGKGINKNLLRDLGYWMSHVQGNAIREANLLQGLFGKLAIVPIKSEVEAEELLSEAYPNAENISQYYPKELRTKREKDTEDFNEGQNGIRKGIYNLFAGAGTEITPDYWGMLNATSEYFCHVQASKKPIAESVMFGNRQKHIMQMVTTLSKKAG